MSTIATITSTTTRQPVAVFATEPVTGPKLVQAAYDGTVTFSKVRGTGTLRHWPVLAKGTPARKQADDIAARRAKGETVEAIAKAMHKSVPTVRRVITALAFTQEIEGLKAADKSAIAKAANANREQAAKAPKEQAKAPAAPAKEATKAPAKPKAPAKAKPATAKAPKESAGARVKRMQAEGKAPVKSATAE
jgi:hypothetical protein